MQCSYGASRQICLGVDHRDQKLEVWPWSPSRPAQLWARAGMICRAVEAVEDIMYPLLWHGLLSCEPQSTPAVNILYCFYGIDKNDNVSVGKDWFFYPFQPAVSLLFLSGLLILSFPTRVSDPLWFNADPDTDPDPAFFLIADPDSGSGFRIRIQGLMT